MINTKSVDEIRIELVGESRAVTATGSQWIAWKDEALRLAILDEELEATAGKVADCWLFLDEIARRSPCAKMRENAMALLRKQQAPGWKS